MKSIIVFVLLALGLPYTGHGQDIAAEKPLSSNDSIRLHGFVDSLNNSSLFSYRYQRFFDSALAIKPWKAYWWQQKAMPLLKQGKYELGIRYVDSAVKNDTKAHYYLEYRAFVKCIFQKNYTGSIADFNLLLALNGNRIVMDHSYNFYKAVCFLQLNDLDSCEYLLTQNIHQRTKEVGADMVHYLDWFYLGIVRYEKEDYKGAIAYFDNSLKVYKQFSDAEYYKALSHRELKQNSQALEYITAANKDFNDGYTINEDNAAHEQYPYQVKKAYIEGQLKYIDGLVKGGKQ